MRNVDNYFSNSVKFLKDLGPSLVEATKKSKIPEYLQKGVKKAAGEGDLLGSGALLTGVLMVMSVNPPPAP